MFLAIFLWLWTLAGKDEHEETPVPKGLNNRSLR